MRLKRKIITGLICAPFVYQLLITTTVGQAVSGPVYSLYAIASGKIDPAREDLEILAHNFTLVQGAFSSSDIKTLHEINPDFKVVRYINSSYTTKPEHVPVVETTYRRSLSMFRVATLGESIDEGIRDFVLHPLSDNDRISLKASTLAAPLSSGERDQPSTRYYVTWIRIGDECMRIEEFNPASGKIKVRRGFDNTQPVSHEKGLPVFSPVYIGSVNDQGAWPGGSGLFLRYAFDSANPAAAQWCVDIAIEAMQQGYDGVWLDICSPTFFNMSDSDGNKVIPWDFRTGRAYDKDAQREGQEVKITTIQNALREKFKHWPVVIANNLQARSFEPGQGGAKILMMPTDSKPRPLDGYCIENFAGGFASRAAIRDNYKGPRFHSVERWRENIIMLMKCARENLPAYPMIANAGIKSKMLEPLGETRDQYEMFAYASYLLGVEKDAPLQLGLPAFYQEGEKRFARLHPRYTWKIGAPIETNLPEQIDLYRSKDHSSYMRHFENGLVIVNPDEKDDSDLNLDTTYIDPESGKETASVRMKAHTGKILLSK